MTTKFEPPPLVGATIAIEKFWNPRYPFASVTTTTNELADGVVGVPLITPGGTQGKARWQ